MNLNQYKQLLVSSVLVVAASISGCGGNDNGSSPVPPVAVTKLTCDSSITNGFKPDVNTTVLLVKAFAQGDPVLLSGTPSSATPIAAKPFCLVKLNVGPGNPGPTSAPSTSAGIGIEIMLPAVANWNQRVHVIGGSGFAGGTQSSTTVIAGLSAIGTDSVIDVATGEGAVSASTDTGHANTVNGGSFAMNPDGTINSTLWNDFSVRAIHEMAVKTRALATAYYGAAPRFSYWDGFSTGGRQGMKEAQVNSADFDGILAGAPAFNWSRFITGELYPQVAFQRDLAGTPLTTAQQDLVSNAAISACDMVGGQHLGYLLDPSSCRYDPTIDASVLCTSDGGTNGTAACVTRVQATVVNKIWYGMTSDGSVPSPAVDNGWAQVATPTTGPTGTQRWYGNTRGTSLYAAGFGGFVNGLASPTAPFPISSDQVALELQNSTIADPSFTNATGNGQSLWKLLSYSQLSNAFDRGVALQPNFANINTDSADLSGFQGRGGKLLHYHGLSDELIFPQGSINYYNRVLAQMGGLATVQSFYRFFLIPGFGHSTPNGTASPTANPPTVGVNQLYGVLTDWVERGIAPTSIVLNSLSSTPVAKSQPICAYPLKATYGGTGSVFAASSYTCS